MFRVFLWLAIGNDHKHDEAYDILDGMPKTSRLCKWCSLDFGGVGREKAVDMNPEGFLEIIDEFSSDFDHLRGLAMELHALLFPLRNGKIFTGTNMDRVSTEQLYDRMANAFDRAARTFRS